jgi:hypothetical protein
MGLPVWGELLKIAHEALQCLLSDSVNLIEVTLSWKKQLLVLQHSQSQKP